MSEEDFLRCLKEFHGPEKFVEIKKTILFNKKINLYEFYETAKRRGGYTDAIIITQWRDICVELGLLSKREKISFEEAYRTSQFFCDCFINFTYPNVGKKYKTRYGRESRTKLFPNYYKIQGSNKSGSGSYNKLLGVKLSRVLRNKHETSKNTQRERNVSSKDDFDTNTQYDNLVWIAKNVMNVPKYKFFSNKDIDECSIYDNQWVLPSHDNSIPLSYKVQSKVACAAKLAAETTENINQSSDELASRSSDSEYDIVLRERGCQEAEMSAGLNTSATVSNNGGFRGGNSTGLTNVLSGSIAPSGPSTSSRVSTITITNIKPRRTRNRANRNNRRKKDVIRNIVHEVAKYLIAGQEIEICLDILFKSLTVVKLPKIPGLCKQIAHINIKLSKELLKHGEFEDQKDILHVLDILCNILILIIRDSFVDFAKHKYNNTYQQSMLCLDSLQVTSCILFLKINEAYGSNKFKQNNFSIYTNKKETDSSDGAESNKTNVGQKYQLRGNNMSIEANLTKPYKLGTIEGSSHRVINSTHIDRSNVINTQQEDTKNHYNTSNEVEQRVNITRHNVTKLKRIYKLDENNVYDRIKYSKLNKISNNTVNSKLYNTLETSDNGYSVDINRSSLMNVDFSSKNGPKERDDKSSDNKTNTKKYKNDKNKSNGSGYDTINHLEILSNMFLLIKYLSAISTELWQCDMICSFIDPFIKTVSTVLTDNKAPKYWLWDDFQKALCILFNSCYNLLQKMEGKMQIKTILKLYMISLSLLKEEGISKLLFRKIVQMILLFHIYIDFQMFHHMYYPIKKTCEILVKTTISTFKNDLVLESGVNGKSHENHSWYAREAVDHLDRHTSRKSDKTPYMNRLFLNVDNPITNPWSSVRRDHRGAENGYTQVPELSGGSMENVVDCNKGDGDGGTGDDSTVVNGEGEVSDPSDLSGNELNSVINEVLFNGDRRNEVNDIRVAYNYDINKMEVESTMSGVSGIDEVATEDITSSAEGNSGIKDGTTEMDRNNLMSPSRGTGINNGGIEGNAEVIFNGKNSNTTSGTAEGRRDEGAKKGNIDIKKLVKKEHMETLFNYESLPQDHDLTLDESVYFLQNYYRSVFGISSRMADSLATTRMDSIRHTGMDSDRASPAKTINMNEKGNVPSRDDKNHKSAGEKSCRHSSKPRANGNRVHFEEPTLVDKEIYDRFKKFENTREIVCLCIAKMTEYSFCLDVVRYNYNKILECAYNDYSSRYFWPIIHKLQIGSSPETCDNLDNYEVMCIEQIK